jgi:peroxiredoxin family protein
MMVNISEVKDDMPVADPGFSQMNEWFEKRFEEEMKKREAAHVPSMALVATKGTLDMAYPPFILASTGAALGWDVSVFFTFYGLLLLKKNVDAKVSPLGNPAMPMKMPMGPKWLQSINIPMPNAVPSLVPGFDNVATTLMKKTFKNNGVASIQELRELSLEADVKMIACQMTVDVFGFSQNDFIDEATFAGAATFLPEAQKADITMFI